MEHTSGMLALMILICFSVMRLPAQGMYWENETKDAVTGATLPLEKFYYMPRIFKQVNESRNEFTIFSLDHQMIMKGNTKERTYSQITFAEFEKRLKSFDAKSASNTKNKSPMNEKPKTMNVVRTGDGKPINGLNCTEFEIQRNGKTLFRIWATAEITGFSAMKKDMEDYLVQTTKLKPGYGEMLAEHMRNVEGFPIQLDNGALTSTVTKVEARTIPMSEFAVPAGYTYLPPKPITEGKSKK